VDRFCRVLCGAGFAVLAPFLPDFLALRVRESLTHDLDRALQYLLNHPEWLAGKKPALFSISFGSLPTLRMLATPRRQHSVGRAIIFGGYADWAKTIRYALTGEIDGRVHGKRDPLNQPVVFMNLLDHLNGLPDDEASLVAAWRIFVERTWGRPEMKSPERFHPIAHDIGKDLSPEVRAAFLLGCGVEGDALSACAEALWHPDLARWVDPHPALSDIRCPVTLVHGLDDDVIPYTQAEELHAALSPHAQSELLLTGLVDHSRAASMLKAGVKEVRTLIRICRVLASPT
jgi:pimeloyl-ACP methyl ester carboxylesterase